MISAIDPQFLQHKTAIITGSTSGIGLGIATALAASGANIMLNGLGDANVIDRAKQEVSNVASGDVDYFPANMLEPSRIEQMIHATRSRFGSVDILVNNAGIQHVSPIADFSTEKWDDIIAINLSAAFHTIRAVSPIMVAQGWGRIINVASVHALVASPFKAAYVAAKHGIAGLTKTVALELAQKHITVNAVAPGYVETPLVTDQVADTARARGISEAQVIEDVMLAAQPTKQFVTIDQVADLVLFLCSARSSAITGTVLPIDGGWSAQ
jgi:3-hydroxybutyrate dehydrogenase